MRVAFYRFMLKDFFSLLVQATRLTFFLISYVDTEALDRLELFVCFRF